MAKVKDFISLEVPSVAKTRMTVTSTGPKDFSFDPPPMRLVPFREAGSTPEEPEEIEDLEQDWMKE